MFTGIVETKGKIISINHEAGNYHFEIQSSISNSLKVDQSVLHNGVCLTVTKLEDDRHYVTAIEETLSKSNLGFLKSGDPVNIEKCMSMSSLLDGHIVQGHVDEMLKCSQIIKRDGSTLFYFDIPKKNYGLIVDRGSICINGVSLTIAGIDENRIYVAIIPYTIEHTNFGSIREGSYVNIEYDILGKYIQRHLEVKS